MFVLLVVGVFARAVHLQILRSEDLASMARDQYERAHEIAARRGAVLDAHGLPLAVSVDVDSVFVDPLKSNPDDAAALASALGLKTIDVRKRLSGRGRFAWIKRRITAEESEAVSRLALPGVHMVKESRRFYPQRELASNLLGFVGLDNEGLEGLERVYDEVLRGTPQEVRALRDVRGARLFAEPGIPSGALAGATVELTIDSAIQLAAERALAKMVTRVEAEGGMVIALEPSTGAVLALASYPTFNPNAPGDAKAGARRNRAVVDTYEPGSTIKPFVVAAALAERVIRPGEKFETTGGRLTLGRSTIRDSHKPKTETITLEELIATSSNVATARIGLSLGRERLVGWLEKFGFGERLDAGLPGEGKGVLQDPRRMGDVAVATTSFGQGMTATPLQVAAALGVLANGGQLMRPFLVRRVVAADGEVLLDRRPEPIRQVVPPEIARHVATLMTAVTRKGGTGTLAAIPGFEVAGKTGTAQKAEPGKRGYSADKRFSSFMGFVPAEAPKVAIFVGIDEPKTDRYGGVVAGPVFREVAEEALRQLGVLVPQSSPGVLQDVLAALESTARPSPAPAIVEVGFVDEAAAGELQRVPDLRGLSARAALRLLSARGLEAEVEGSGRVTSQQPPPGGTVNAGARVKLVLKAG